MTSETDDVTSRAQPTLTEDAGSARKPLQCGDCSLPEHETRWTMLYDRARPCGVIDIATISDI
jgi:hypothetical protein